MLQALDLLIYRLYEMEEIEKLEYLRQFGIARYHEQTSVLESIA